MLVTPEYKLFTWAGFGNLADTVFPKADTCMRSAFVARIDGESPSIMGSKIDESMCRCVLSLLQSLVGDVPLAFRFATLL